MRVRVMHRPDPTSSQAVLEVQRWCSGQWEHVINFQLHASEQANEFAMKLSMTKRIPTELAVYLDGEKVEGPRLEPLFTESSP